MLFNAQLRLHEPYDCCPERRLTSKSRRVLALMQTMREFQLATRTKQNYIERFRRIWALKWMPEPGLNLLINGSTRLQWVALFTGTFKPVKKDGADLAIQKFG